MLDGVEKAERNVLPTLNNLLENREMALEDGRFLVAPDVYDDLVAGGEGAGGAGGEGGKAADSGPAAATSTGSQSPSGSGRGAG